MEKLNKAIVLRTVVCANFQSYAAAFHQWIVLAAVVTYGEIVTDGDGVVLQVFVEHVVHIGETVVGTLVF